MRIIFVLVLVLAAQTVLASNCINLNDYQLDIRNFSASEVDAFNLKKFEYFRSFVLAENQISSKFSKELQDLYLRQISDTDLQKQIQQLNNRKAKKVQDNCELYKKKLLKLKREY